MSKFKVGDFVKGNSNKYPFTNRDMTMAVVTNVRTNGEITVEVLSHKREIEIGMIYSNLTPDCFDLVESPQNYVVYTKGNEVIALDKATGKKAVAKCAPDDTFDFMTGAKLAFERLTGTGVKEVKRHAEVGEYVKVVKESDFNDEDDYRNGDILQIVKAHDRYYPGNKNIAFYKNARWKYLNDSEYVVLENYKPEKKQEKAKEIVVGSKVVVTDGGYGHPTYVSWVEKYIKNIGVNSKYAYGESVKTGMEGTVLKIAPHILFCKKTLCYIDCGEKCYLIGIEGLELKEGK